MFDSRGLPPSALWPRYSKSKRVVSGGWNPVNNFLHKSLDSRYCRIIHFFKSLTVMILSLLESCFLGFMIIYVWLDTNAFYEYAKILKYIDKNCFEPYEKFNKTTGVESLFSEYLATEDGFFPRLLSCPICLSVWVSWFFCAAYRDLTILHIGIVFFGINIIYFCFKRIVRLNNE